MFSIVEFAISRSPECHVLVDRSIGPGGSVVLRIANVGDFAGQVAWSKGNRLGICFDEASDRLAELIREEPT
jgi:hypothetical protein